MKLESGSGISMPDQRVPFHRSARGFGPPDGKQMSHNGTLATATHAVVDGHDTLLNSPAVGGSTHTDEREPDFRSATFDAEPLACTNSPTAMHTVGETQETAENDVPLHVPAGLPVGSIVQCVPFHRSSRAPVGDEANIGPGYPLPTAVQEAADTHDTPVSAASGQALGFGDRWIVQPEADATCAPVVQVSRANAASVQTRSRSTAPPTSSQEEFPTCHVN